MNLINFNFPRRKGVRNPIHSRSAHGVCISCRNHFHLNTRIIYNNEGIFRHIFATDFSCASLYSFLHLLICENWHSWICDKLFHIYMYTYTHMGNIMSQIFSTNTCNTYHHMTSNIQFMFQVLVQYTNLHVSISLSI